MFVNSRFNLTAQVLNLKTIRVSLSILLFGSILMGLAPTSVLLIAGKSSAFATSWIHVLGAIGTMYAMLTALSDCYICLWLRCKNYSTFIDNDVVSKAYEDSSLQRCFFIEQGGMLVGEPLLQNILAFALELPRFWFGLPFFCSSVSIYVYVHYYLYENDVLNRLCTLLLSSALYSFRQSLDRNSFFSKRRLNKRLRIPW